MSSSYKPGKTQMNFEGGVNRKTVREAASLAAAEKGEAKRPVQQFPCDVEAPKGRTPHNGPQINFRNGN